ncbi:MAG: hypothetical protein ACYC21_02945 [Eubacteriales bacterium]
MISKRVLNTLMALIISLALATANLAGLYYLWSPGLSLTLSLWLLFWLSVSNQSGKSSPVRTIR